MEKKVLIKIVKITFLTIFFVSFLALLLVDKLLMVSGLNHSTSSLIYWVVLIGWLVVNFLFKIKSRGSFIVSLMLFSVASVLYLLGLFSVSETLMRLFFIGVCIGFLQSLVEYSSSKQK